MKFYRNLFFNYNLKKINTYYSQVHYNKVYDSVTKYFNEINSY